MISRLLGRSRKPPNASRVSKPRMARFIPNAEINEPHDELAMRYLAVETRRDALTLRGMRVESGVARADNIAAQHESPNTWGNKDQNGFGFLHRQAGRPHGQRGFAS